MSAHKMHWFRRWLYELSCHTDIEQALRWAKAQGWRSGCAYCPRCQKSKLTELEPGLFTCPTCKIDTDSYFTVPVRTGALARAYPFKTDTQQVEAIRARNGPDYQQRLTRRLQYQPEEGEK